MAKAKLKDAAYVDITTKILVPMVIRETPSGLDRRLSSMHIHLTEDLRCISSTATLGGSQLPAAPTQEDPVPLFGLLRQQQSYTTPSQIPIIKNNTCF